MTALISSPPGQNGRRFAEDKFRCIFLNEDDKIPIRISQKFNWQKASIGSGNDLAPNRRQAITWTNTDPIHWCIYVALGRDGLSYTCSEGLIRALGIPPTEGFRAHLPHDDVMTCKRFPHYSSTLDRQLMWSFDVSLLLAWENCWTNIWVTGETLMLKLRNEDDIYTTVHESA